MSTAVEPAEQIDQAPGGDGAEEEEDSHPNEFSWYIKPEPTAVILEKRWGWFSLFTAICYFYHFISVIFGVDMYCHHTRFQQCTGADTFLKASGVYDGALMIVSIFHIIEWIRQTIEITSVLVGVPWLPAYFALSINIPFGIIALIYGMAVGFGSDATCQTAQPGRSTFLKLQLLSFFLYLMWCMKHVVLFKLGNILFPPKETEEDGTLKYQSWVQKQYEMEEEEDDD